MKVTELKTFYEKGISDEILIQITKNWYKPFNDLGFTFDECMQDPNKKITMALKRFDESELLSSGKTFDLNKVDDFQRDALNKFIESQEKPENIITNDRIIGFLHDDLKKLESMIQERQDCTYNNNVNEYEEELTLLNYMQSIIVKLQ